MTPPLTPDEEREVTNRWMKAYKELEAAHIKRQNEINQAELRMVLIPIMLIGLVVIISFIYVALHK